MFWRHIKGWPHCDMEPSLSLVSIIDDMIGMFAYAFSCSIAPPSVTVGITICILPEELTTEWDKQLFGGQMITNVASLLASNDGWKCRTWFHLFILSTDDILGNVPGLFTGPITLSITCMVSDVLVSFILQFNIQIMNRCFRLHQMGMTACHLWQDIKDRKSVV